MVERRAAVAVPEAGLVLVDLQVAARWAPALRDAARRARAEHGLPLHSSLLEVVEAFEHAAAHALSWASSGQVPPPVPTLDAAGSDRRRSRRVLLDAAAVARLAGVTPRAVTKAASEGRLAGHRDHRGWWTFEQQAVDAWLAGRRGQQTA
jgi:hypothetical protein